jgi:hypothetical protein
VRAFERYRHRAEECRMTAGALAGLCVASALAAGAILYSSGPQTALLACVSCAIVFGLGVLNELRDAARLDRRAIEERELQAKEGAE